MKRSESTLAIPESGTGLASCRRASGSEERDILAREIDKRRNGARWVFTAGIGLIPIYALIIQALFRETRQHLLPLDQHPWNLICLIAIAVAAMMWLMTVSWIQVADIAIVDGMRPVVYDNAVLRRNYWESTLYLRVCTVPLFFSPLIAALVYGLLVSPVTPTTPLFADIALFVVFMAAYQWLQAQWQRFLRWALTAARKFAFGKFNAAAGDNGESEEQSTHSSSDQQLTYDRCRDDSNEEAGAIS